MMIPQPSDIEDLLLMMRSIMNIFKKRWRISVKGSSCVLNYYEQSLGIDKKVFSDQHPSVAMTLNNTALVQLEDEMKP